MRLLHGLWLVCLFVLFDQLHPQNFLPNSSVFVAHNSWAVRLADQDFAAISATALTDDTVGMADPADNIDTLEPEQPAMAEQSAEESVPAADAAASLPVPTPRRRVSREELCDTVVSAAQANNLPIGFLVRLIWQESGFDPQVVSRAGAQGLAQFMPRVAAEWGLNDPFDPLQALPASARLLRSLHRQFGNLGLAAAAYNAGSGRIQNWLTKRGKLPQETRDYVMNITGHPAEKWVRAAPHSLSFRLPSRAPCQEIAALDKDAIPLPVPKPALPPVVAASAASNPKPVQVAQAGDPLPMIAAPASIMVAAQAHPRGAAKKQSIMAFSAKTGAPVTANGKMQRLVITVKAAVKSASKPVNAPLQLAKVTPAGKPQAGKAAAKTAIAKSPANRPLQLAMVTRSSRK